MDKNKAYSQSLKLHKKHKGKLEIKIKTPVKKKSDLTLVYTPGIAAPCREIAKDQKQVYTYTNKANAIAVISDGSSVLGLGNIGATASIPVMEGKALLLKQFANIDATPICFDTQDPDEIIKTIRIIAPCFGAIHLEDIKAPQCFTIEQELQDLGIPVMHDDQHGTAVVVLAGIINACTVLNKKIESSKVVINGAGAAGVAILKLLLHHGLKKHNVIMCDSSGIIVAGRSRIKGTYKEEIVKISNTKKKKGTLTDALKGADIFIGVSRPKQLDENTVKSMNACPIIFALANPIPEILPELAKKGGACIVATGRSDYPNQVNNALAFPGIFRGALDARATRIDEKMLLAAAQTLAKMVKKPNHNKILPDLMDKTITPRIARAVKKSWTSRYKKK